jgi:hypothetical protein
LLAQDWPEPTNVSELRSCRGTFNYWRSYIRNFSDVVSPLVAFTRKNALWRWRANMEGHALQQLKVALLEAPVIIPPNPDKPSFLVTDASDCAIGASVEQEEGEGNRRRAVAVFLHSLNPAERKYPVHERESLAIVLALSTWRVHLYGSEFPVYCHNDHRPLHQFLTHSNLSPRQVRWQQLLFQYNLTVAYVPGKSNAFADESRDIHDLMIHKTFLSFMMSFVNKYHSDWEDLVLSMLYAIQYIAIQYST